MRCRGNFASPSIGLLPAQRPREFFCRNFRLTENACKRTDPDLIMHRYNATLRVAFHDQVASTLTHFVKTQALQGALNFGAGNMRQLRHVPVQSP